MAAPGGKRKREQSFIDYDVETCDFPLENLPFGAVVVGKKPDGKDDVHLCTVVGDKIVDLFEIETAGLLASEPLIAGKGFFLQPTLNLFMSQPRAVWTAARCLFSSLLSCDGKKELRDNENLKKKCLRDLQGAKLVLAFQIGDYTDFYASIQHATNIGTLWRGKDNALMPNWRHLPVGYHGRASSVVVSGTDITRPCGQTKADDAEAPTFGPSKLLDFELEMGLIYGGPSNALGERITTTQAHDHLFGVCILNDWSSRDIQKWEYVPLGPFLGKNFGSTVSPWVVTIDALSPFFVASPTQEPAVLPYLQEKEKNTSLNVALTVDLQPHNTNKTNPKGEWYTISKSNMRHLYWSSYQMIAHHTASGCNMSAGDLLGTGTISGDDESSYGSMLELCWRGTKTIDLPNGDTRKFLQDGDAIRMSAVAQGDGYRIGFGTCEGRILPAKI